MSPGSDFDTFSALSRGATTHAAQSGLSTASRLANGQRSCATRGDVLDGLGVKGAAEVFSRHATKYCV